MSTKLTTVTLLLLLLIFVIELVRREKLTFKYAAGWLLILLIGLFFAVFERCLFAISRWLGFQLPSNFIFFGLLGSFVFLSLLLTIFLCQQNDRNDTIAQKIAMLEYELKKLKGKENQKD